MRKEMRHQYFRNMLGLSKSEQDEASGWIRPQHVTWLQHAVHGFLAITGPKALSDNCADICSGAGLPPGALSISEASAKVVCIGERKHQGWGLILPSEIPG